MQSTIGYCELKRWAARKFRERLALAPGVLLTEGVTSLAAAARAHWLTEAIASYIYDDKTRTEAFQVWTLNVEIPDRNAQLRITDGNSNTPVITQITDPRALA